MSDQMERHSNQANINTELAKERTHVMIEQ